MFLACPLHLHSADLHWCSIGVGGEGDRQTTNIGPVSLTLETRAVPEATFKEDNLILTVHAPGKPSLKKWCSSSYGQIEVAVHRNLLFLKYGIGRGTCAREEYVKILKLDEYLHELADVHSSYYANLTPKKVSPDLVTYRATVQSQKQYTTITFVADRKAPGIPTAITVRFKNED
jgi:hypothetical protein